jgi:hypothetical protein
MLIHLVPKTVEEAFPPDSPSGLTVSMFVDAEELAFLEQFRKS